MAHQIIVTADGSKTIYLPHLDETYHSSNGAVQEAVHVFLKHGLHAVEAPEIDVFEMGFGTGLNALLAYIESEKLQKKIRYSGIEAFPVSIDVAQQMDYCSLLGNLNQDKFDFLHNAEWNQQTNASAFFTFEKIHQKIEEYTPQIEHFDIVFYDAFGPRAQEDMWAPAILKKMYDLLKSGGFLVTYCAKGQVKRDLKALGFEIEPLPGPPGKREMTRAWKR